MPRKPADPNQLNEISKRFFNRVDTTLISNPAVKRNSS